MNEKSRKYLPVAWADEYMPEFRADPNSFLVRDDAGLKVSCADSERAEFPNCSFLVELGDVVELVQIDELGELKLEYNNEFGLIEIDRVPEGAFLFFDGLTDEGALPFDVLQQMVKDEWIGEVEEGLAVTATGFIWTEGHCAVVCMSPDKSVARLELMPFVSNFETSLALHMTEVSAEALLDITQHDWCVVLLGRHNPANPSELPIIVMDSRKDDAADIPNKLGPKIVEKVFKRPKRAAEMRKKLKQLNGLAD